MCNKAFVKVTENKRPISGETICDRLIIVVPNYERFNSKTLRWEPSFAPQYQIVPPIDITPEDQYGLKRELNRVMKWHDINEVEWY